MSTTIRNLTLENNFNLENFTIDSGNDLYVKLDGVWATRGTNYEAKSLDGGIKFSYTRISSKLTHPIVLLDYDNDTWTLSNIFTRYLNDVRLTYADDSGSIAFYVDGVLLYTATNLLQINYILMETLIPNTQVVNKGFSMNPVQTTYSSLVLDTNCPVMDYLADETKLEIWDEYEIGVEFPPSNVCEQIVDNFGGGVVEDNTVKYFMYNTYATGKGSFDGFEVTGSPTIRNENIYTEGVNTLALYYNGTDNSLHLISKPNSIYQVYYSDGGQTYDNGKNIYYNTFYNYWQGKLGTTIGASRVETNIPIFDTMDLANGYLNGIVDISSARNYDDLSGSINPQNKTGLQEISTEFSDTYHTSIFGIQLACSVSALREIANIIYSEDSTVWGNVKKGLEMFGENIMDAIIDLTYYPFDVTSVVSGTVSQNYINFGSFRAELSHALHRIVYSNGYVDAGTVNFLPTYKNWIDYAHTGLQVYLPYIGMKTLDPAHYMGKTINVRYYFDFHSRGCTACIIADGVLMDYFNGQIGISQPVNSRDFASYAESVINNTLDLANPAGGIAKDVVGGLASNGGLGATGAVGLALSAGIGIDSVLATGAYDYVTNKAKVQSKGSVGSDTGGHMPQYVFFKFTYEDPIAPSNLLQIYGKPSNAGGSVSSFGGFLKCSSVKLQCNRATAKERDEIKAQLYNGIYI